MPLLPIILAALCWIGYRVIGRVRQRYACRRGAHYAIEKTCKSEDREVASKVAWAIEVPARGETVPPTGFLLRGWVTAGTRRLLSVVARHAGTQIGETAVPYVRDEIAQGRPTAYRVFIEPGLGQTPGDYEIEIFARFDGDAGEVDAGSVTCRLSHFDERGRDYGGLSNTDWVAIPHREHIYTVGPPSRHCAPGMVELLFSYIEKDATVLDVGCGAAPYADSFLESGRHWMGCEVREDLVLENRARGLPITLLEGSGLPFEERSFDFALCIEVLEHIEAYEPFVAEIARVARRGACFSVPNARAIPRLAPFGVVPWHLLEGSHVNFFTAVNLRDLLRRHFAHVDTFEYAPIPLGAVDGTSIFNHVFAVAMHASENQRSND